MSITKTLGRIGIVLAVAGAVALVGCKLDGDDNPGGNTGGGDNYNNGEVRIGNQTWTTKNININTANSWCYDDDLANCAIYGRMYTWEAAKSVCASMGGGWRLPTREDWENLVTYVGGASTAGIKLKANSGWNSSGNGTDDYGFSALPGGARYSDGHFDYVGDRSDWWSASEGGYGAYDRRMHYNSDAVSEGTSDKRDGCVVRCVKD